MSAKGVCISGIVGCGAVLIVPGSGLFVAWTDPPYGIFQKLGLLVFVMYYAFVACAAFVLWATKQVFNAFGYRSADLTIGTLFALLACLPPVAPLAWAWFSILATRFGKQVGSLLWQAIGIVYLLSLLLIALGMTSLAGVDVPYREELFELAYLMLLAGWLCHCVCLILGARKMPRIDPAVPDAPG